MVPPSFWLVSLISGLLVSAYAVRLRDPVFVLGQLSGILVYARNLMLIRRRHLEKPQYDRA